MEQASIKHIPLETKGSKKSQVSSLTPDVFFQKILEKNDVVVIGDDHTKETFKSIGTHFPDFQKGGACAVFIELSKDQQGHIDKAVKAAKTTEYDGFKICSPLYYPSKNNKLPLVCMDAPTSDREFDLGIGNADEILKARRLHAAKYGMEATLNNEDEFNKKRLNDNSEWIKNIKEHVKQHHIKKFIVIGGTLHTSDITERISKEMGLKTVHLVIQGTGKRIIEPLIVSAHSRLDLNEDEELKAHFRIYFPNDSTLTPKEREKIRGVYEDMLEKASLRQVEFVKWQHAKALQNIAMPQSFINNMLKGQNKDLKTYEKVLGDIPEEDFKILQQAQTSLQEARAAMDEPTPKIAYAKERVGLARLVMEKNFCGGYNNLAKQCVSKKIEFHMLVEAMISKLESATLSLNTLEASTADYFTPPAMPAAPTIEKPSIKR